MPAIGDYPAVQPRAPVELHATIHPAAPFYGHRNGLLPPFRALATTFRAPIT